MPAQIGEATRDNARDGKTRQEDTTQETDRHDTRDGQTRQQDTARHDKTRQQDKTHVTDRDVHRYVWNTCVEWECVQYIPARIREGRPHKTTRQDTCVPARIRDHTRQDTCFQRQQRVGRGRRESRPSRPWVRQKGQQRGCLVAAAPSVWP